LAASRLGGNRRAGQLHAWSDEAAAELGLLVEEAWQRRGLGTRLDWRDGAHASAAGLRVLEAQLVASRRGSAVLSQPTAPAPPLDPGGR